MIDKITVEDIRRHVCSHFDIDEADILDRNRKQEIAQARQVAMYFTSEYTDHKLKTIGLLFGGRDHSTVSSSIRKVKELRKVDPEFNNDILELNDKLLQKRSSQNIKRMEKEAKKEAVRVHGSLTHNPFGTNVAELAEPLYCFTEKELFEYKQELKKQ